ncbi:hypothetical protein MMC15_003770 [Xylographa vitiligo]|nr:hypothetical protein [Xylographa vitiligo]
MATYQPIPRSSTSSDDDHPPTPPSPPPPILKSVSVTIRSLFRLDAILFATAAISCIGAADYHVSRWRRDTYRQCIIFVYVVLGLSILSQLGALAAAGLSQKMHISIAWKGKHWTGPNETRPGSRLAPPAARQQHRPARYGVLGNVLFGGVLVIFGLVFMIIELSRGNAPVGPVGQLFCFLTGIVHLILAFLPAKYLEYRVLLAITTAPDVEISLEPKSPAVYRDEEEDPALDV